VFKLLSTTLSCHERHCGVTISVHYRTAKSMPQWHPIVISINQLNDAKIAYTIDLTAAATMAQVISYLQSSSVTLRHSLLKVIHRKNSLIDAETRRLYSFCFRQGSLLMSQAIS